MHFWQQSYVFIFDMDDPANLKPYINELNDEHPDIGHYFTTDQVYV